MHPLSYALDLYRMRRLGSQHALSETANSSNSFVISAIISAIIDFLYMEICVGVIWLVALLLSNVKSLFWDSICWLLCCQLWRHGGSLGSLYPYRASGRSGSGGHGGPASGLSRAGLKRNHLGSVQRDYIALASCSEVFAIKKRATGSIHWFVCTSCGYCVAIHAWTI